MIWNPGLDAPRTFVRAADVGGKEPVFRCVFRGEPRKCARSAWMLSLLVEQRALMVLEQ
jgi:hypothetical protein